MTQNKREGLSWRRSKVWLVHSHNWSQPDLIGRAGVTEPAPSDVHMLVRKAEGPRAHDSMAHCYASMA